MMKYQYNYSFLQNWMEANKNISASDVLQAIGTTSRESFRLYVDRKCPMPTTSILRFCNTFGVPISAFIVDAAHNDDDVVPSINDQLEPDGGYLPMGEKRPAGGRALRDPLEVVPVPSIVPGLATKEPIRPDTIQPDDVPQASDTISPSLTTLNKMLDIIAEQQKQINEQQKQIGEQQKLIAELSHRLGIQQPSLGMVADEIHHTSDEH